MAEFQKVIKDRLRMCTTIKECENCPISQYNNGKDAMCQKYVVEYTDEAEKKIEDWVIKHTPKTNRDKFKEVFGYELHTLCYATSNKYCKCHDFCEDCPYYADAEYHIPEGGKK